MPALSRYCLPRVPMSAWSLPGTWGEKNDATLVRECIRWGSDINAQDRTGATPIYCAVTLRYGEIAEILIDAGADVNKEVTFVGPFSPTG